MRDFDILKSKTMNIKPIRHSEPLQLRLWRWAVFFFAETFTIRDSRAARWFVQRAAYYHQEIVCLDKWTGVWGVIRREAKRLGVTVILCKTLQQCLNTADSIKVSCSQTLNRLYTMRGLNGQML